MQTFQCGMSTFVKVYVCAEFCFHDPCLENKHIILHLFLFSNIAWKSSEATYWNV